MNNETASEAHLCAAVDCTMRIGTGLLMCKEHWFMVPRGLREEVWRQYEVLMRREPGAVAAYRKAMEAAKAAVLDKELNPDLSLTKGSRRTQV